MADTSAVDTNIHDTLQPLDASWWDKLTTPQMNITDNPQLMGKETVMGMTPDQLSAVLGQIAAATSGDENSWQAKLGKVATSIGQAKIQADIAKEQDRAARGFLKELFTQSGHGGSLAAANADPKFDSNAFASNPFSSFVNLKYNTNATPGGGGQ